MMEKLDGRIGTVGVFVDQNDSEIMEMLDFCHLDYAQVYRKTDHTKPHQGLQDRR